jgi:hypothetical protein
MGTSNVSNDIDGLYWSYFVLYSEKGCCSNTKLFCCCCMSIFDSEAIIYHLWLMESKWLRKDRYGHQQCVKWYSWSILIIIYVLYSEKGLWWNDQNCVAVACSYLWWRPSFVTCAHDKWSQKDWERPCMGTSNVSNGIAGLYWLIIATLSCIHICGGRRPSFVTCCDEWSQSDWSRTCKGTTSNVWNDMSGLNRSYTMSCIQKKAINAMPRTMLLLHAHIYGGGHHLFSLVMN